MKNNSSLTDLNAKCTKFDFCSRGKNLQRCHNPSWWGGRLAAHSLIGATYGTQCREAAIYVVTLYLKKRFRSFIGGVPATGTLCFHSATISWIIGAYVEGPPSQGRVGPPNF